MIFAGIKINIKGFFSPLFLYGFNAFIEIQFSQNYRSNVTCLQRQNIERKTTFTCEIIKVCDLH